MNFPNGTLVKFQDERDNWRMGEQVGDKPIKHGNTYLVREIPGIKKWEVHGTALHKVKASEELELREAQLKEALANLVTYDTKIKEIEGTFKEDIDALQEKLNALYDKRDKATKEYTKKQQDESEYRHVLVRQVKTLKDQLLNEKWEERFPNNEEEFSEYLRVKRSMGNLDSFNPRPGKLSNGIKIIGLKYYDEKNYLAIKDGKGVGIIWIQPSQHAGDTTQANGEVNGEKVRFERGTYGGDLRPLRTWIEELEEL